MRLKEWLARNDKSAAEFAEELGYHRVYMQQINRGSKIPGAHFMRVVKIVTNGEVTEDDWLVTKSDNKEKEVSDGCACGKQNN